jgi:uncharacterized repeat protein (TIGR03803 family)
MPFLRVVASAAFGFAALALASGGPAGGALPPPVAETVGPKTSEPARGFQQLFTFQSAGQGGYPMSGVMVDGAGNIFGVTYYEGANYCGVLFELVPGDAGYSESVLRAFSSSVDGCNPDGVPVRDSATGDLFVTTSQGGSPGEGTLIRFVPTSGGYQESAIHSFQYESGYFPHGQVAVSGSEVYVTASSGGEKNVGSLIGLSKGTLEQKLVYQFTGPNGDYPLGGVVADSKGVLYGTTAYGGTYNEGIVFKFTPNGNGGTESILWNFGATVNDGTGPVSDPLLIDETGTIYGTTSGGGIYNQGTVFKLVPNGSGYSETILYSFGGWFDGAEPLAGVTRVGNELWGTTVYGGGKPCACGTVFSMSMTGSRYRRRFSFQGLRNGSQPYGGLFWDGQALYGSTLLGASTFNGGSVFRYVP